MKTLIETATELIAMEIENTINSKVDGRRNWVIRVENRGTQRVITYCGGYGLAEKYGELSCMIKELCKNQVRWYKFTYKKDYKEALNKLLNAGVINYWD